MLLSVVEAMVLLRCDLESRTRTEVVKSLYVIGKDRVVLYACDEENGACGE